MNKKKIICWGDSITAGMGMKPENTYPAILNRLLGTDYSVINAGGGGEDAITIASRQGAYKVFTASQIVFNKGESAVDITVDKFKMQFCLDNDYLLNISLHPNPFCPYEFESELVYIKGQEYFLPKNGKFYELKRKNVQEKVVIARGSEVEFLSAIEQNKGSFCEIFYIGTNGRVSGIPTENDINFLIEQNLKMIERHGNDCYLVIIPYWSSCYTDAYVKAFGEKAVDFREELLKRGATEMGLIPTDNDLEVMKDGVIPPMFRLNNNPNDIHLNEYGYAFMAQLVHQRGRRLGYWE